MLTSGKRTLDQVTTEIKTKVSGDAQWNMCNTADISARGMLFKTNKRLRVNATINLQIMVNTGSRNLANTLFQVKAKVMRIITEDNNQEVAVKFNMNTEQQYAMIRTVNKIRANSLKIISPTIGNQIHQIGATA